MEKIKQILSTVGRDINLTLFDKNIIEDLERNIHIKFYTKCFIRNKEIQLKS
jgi:hypothetical protein